MCPDTLRYPPVGRVFGGKTMREKLLRSIDDRLDELRTETDEERSREIRQLQQLVVGVREADERDGD